MWKGLNLFPSTAASILPEISLQYGVNTKAPRLSIGLLTLTTSAPANMVSIAMCGLNIRVQTSGTKVGLPTLTIDFCLTLKYG